MKRVLKWFAILFGVLVVAAVGFYVWASLETSSLLERTYEVHAAEFPIPFPLSEAEIEALRAERVGGAEMALDGTGQPVDPLAGVDLAAVALERARERGRHLVESRYACTACHGEDFGGGTMIDDRLVGTLLGPNLTSGAGNVVADYDAADWDRIVRHGVKPDGRATAMPSEDFQRMSDQELSDIVAYVQSLPPVDRAVEPVSLGPLLKVLMALGEVPLSADRIEHDVVHAERPPAAEPTAAFGEHLMGVCTGCHRPTLEGGPIAGAPPTWVPASNLTPHADGLGGWTYEQFADAMRQGIRADGTSLVLPMTDVIPYTRRMSDVEMQAMWQYLQSLPPLPDGE